MRPMQIGRPLVLLAATLGLALLVSCSEDECPVPDRDIALRDTPQHLITSFADVLEARSIDDYFWCLDDDYRFTFIEQDWDAAGVTAGAPYWEKCRDVGSTTHMFRDSRVLSIRCDLLIVGDMTATDTLATCTCGADISVKMEHGEDTITYWVNQSLLHLALTRDRSNQGLWVIRTITEEIETSGLVGLSSSPRATEPTSFGSIKAMFK